MCGNENISGIPLLIEKLSELIRYMVAERPTDPERQLIQPFLSV